MSEQKKVINFMDILKTVKTKKTIEELKDERIEKQTLKKVKFLKKQFGK